MTSLLKSSWQGKSELNKWVKEMQLSITLPPKPKPPKLWRLPKRLSNRPGDTFRWLGVEDERFWGDFEGDLHARQLFTAPGRSHPLPPLLRGRERPPPPQNGRQRAQPALTEGRRGNQRPSPLHHHHQTSPPFAHQQRPHQQKKSPIWPLEPEHYHIQSLRSEREIQMTIYRDHLVRRATKPVQCWTGMINRAKPPSLAKLAQ